MSKSPPKAGTITGRVWEIADTQSKLLGEVATRSNVVSRAVEQGINPNTANTQFGHWKRFHHGYGPVGTISEVPTDTLLHEHAPSLLWDQLLKNGFNYLGDWTVDGDGRLKLERTAPAKSGVYAFVEEQEVTYVGVTHRTIRQRMSNYVSGSKGQKTSSRIKMRLLASLADGNTLRILFACPEDGQWNSLPVNIISGLEEGLIRKFKPRWNLRGTK